MKTANLFIILFCLLSCNKDPLELPTPNPDRVFYNGAWKVLWQEALTADTTSAVSIQPVLYQNNVLFSTRFVTDREPLFMRNQQNGALVWSSDQLTGYIPTTGVKLHQGHLIASITSGVIPIDLQSGNKLWRKTFNHSGIRTNIIDSQIYYSHGSSYVDYDTCFLLRTHYTENNWEPVFQVVKSKGFTPSIEPPVKWINDKGESLLIFQLRQWNFSEAKGKVDLYAYNQTTNDYEWIIEDLTPTGNSAIHLPLIHNDKVYFLGMRTVSCIDPATGELIWQVEPGSSFASCPAIVAENMLIANGDNDDLYAFNLDTGAKIWENKNTASTVDNMVYYQGHIYFGSAGDGQLHCIRTGDGQEIWAKDSPNERNYSAGFRQGITINPETGILYTTDAYFAMAIQLEEQ